MLTVCYNVLRTACSSASQRAVIPAFAQFAILHVAAIHVHDTIMWDHNVH